MEKKILHEQRARIKGVNGSRITDKKRRDMVDVNHIYAGYPANGRHAFRRHVAMQTSLNCSS